MFQKISCLSCIKLSNFDLKINGEKKFTINNIYILFIITFVIFGKNCVSSKGIISWNFTQLDVFWIRMTLNNNIF